MGWALAGEDPDLAAMLSLSVPCVFGSRQCLLHPDRTTIHHPASLVCIAPRAGREMPHANLIRELRQREIRYQLRLELSFVLCFEHVLPLTSHWRWQPCLPHHKAAARDSEGGSCSASVSLENNKYWLTRAEARGIRL